MNRKRWGIPPGDSQSVSLYASCHNEQQYLWFRDGFLISSYDIKPYGNWREYGIPQGDPRLLQVNASYNEEQEYI